MVVGLGAEHADQRRRQQGGRRSFPGDVSDDESEPADRQVDVVEEVAADRSARDRRAGGGEERAGAAGGGQQRLLDGGRDLQLLIQFRALERLAIEPRVLDGHGGFRAQRLERRAGRRRAQRAPLPAVEIEHADHFVFGALVGALDVAHQPQRRAEHVANADRDGAGVLLREIAVEQVLDDGFPAGREDGLGNLPAGREGLARQRQMSARSGELEFELAGAVGEHDESALGAGDVDRRIQHQRQHVVEHATRAERAQPLEQAGHVPDLADRGDRASLLRRRVVADGEDDLGVVGLAERDAVAAGQHPLGRPLAVDEGSEARPAVAQPADAVLGDDLRVLARDAGARHADVGFAASARA